MLNRWSFIRRASCDERASALSETSAFAMHHRAAARHLIASGRHT
jgi:hypothetical protein